MRKRGARMGTHRGFTAGGVEVEAVDANLLRPSVRLLRKLATLVVNVSPWRPEGLAILNMTGTRLLADPEVKAWFTAMEKAGFAKVRR